MENKIELTYLRVDPDTGNLIYRGTDGYNYVELEGIIHDMTDEGEPLAPVYNVRIKTGEPIYNPEDRFGRNPGSKVQTSKIDNVYELNKIVGPTNTIHATVEEDFNGGYSILVFDELGDVWIEKFSKDLEEAKKIADETFNKMVKRFTYAEGGSIEYQDLSKLKPEIVNDGTGVSEISEVDLVKTNVIKLPGADKIHNYHDAYDVFKAFWDKNRINISEQFNVLLIDQSNAPIGIYQHTSGGINYTIADIELISAVAIKALAKAVIVAHNHPSGNLIASEADISLTKKLRDALQLFNIKLLDSLIISPDGTYISMSELHQFAEGGTINSDIKKYFKSLNAAELPLKAADYLKTELLNDKDIDLLDPMDEDFVEIQNIISTQYPGALKATGSEPTKQEYIDALNSHKAMIKFATGDDKKQHEEALMAVKTMLKIQYGENYKYGASIN